MGNVVPTNSKVSRLRLLGVILTTFGLALFAYFIYRTGVDEIWNGVSRLGYGFLVILLLYALKLSTRALAWTMSVEKPYKLGFFNALKAVMMAEALSSMIPLGILISGTSKAIAVRNQLPLVVGLSSVAVENLFYSLATGILIMGGCISFLLIFDPAANIAAAGYALVAIITALIIGGFFMVVQEWRFASWLAEWLYGKGLAKRVLHHGRAEVRRFEELIYGFYRNHPRRFLPIMLLQVVFHGLGIFEVWFILQSISDTEINFLTAFLLESVNRVILVVFKLIPLGVGVTEIGGLFITQTLDLGNLGGVLETIRKVRVLFWAGIGMLLIARSGLSFRELAEQATTAPLESEKAASIN